MVWKLVVTWVGTLLQRAMVSDHDGYRRPAAVVIEFTPPAEAPPPDQPCPAPAVTVRFEPAIVG